MSIEHNLGNLKMKMVVEKDLRVIWDYFMDEFSTNVEFLEMGEPLQIDNHPVAALVARASAATVIALGETPNEAKVGLFAPVHIPEYGFIHGATMIHGRMMMYFYFEDLEVGMTAYDVLNSQVTMTRITRRAQPDPHRR